MAHVDGRALIVSAFDGTWVNVVGDVPPIGSIVIFERSSRSLILERTPTKDARLADFHWFHDRGHQRARALRDRQSIIFAIRGYFGGQDFLEVETPSAVPSPGLDLHLSAFGVDDQWLITSPEYQMKRLLSAGFERIFQISRCFRRDEQGANHEPEFTMLEWYRAFAGCSDVMLDTEILCERAAVALSGSSSIATDRGAMDWKSPWPRLTVADAFAKFAKKDLASVLPDESDFFRIWIEEVEPNLGCGAPVWITHWPASMASLAKLSDDDASTAERFEAYVHGIELCNGFGELTDPLEQRARLVRDQAARRERGLPVYPLDERFLAALESGLPSSGGNALGLDRLVMLLTGAANVQDVVAFARSRL